MSQPQTQMPPPSAAPVSRKRKRGRRSKTRRREESRDSVHTAFDFPSFDHIEDPRERRAKTLLQQLNLLASYYPEFRRHLSDAIEEMELQARPRAQLDREHVFEILQHSPMQVSELCTKTGLKGWKVRKLLGELMFLGRVEEIPESRHVTHASQGGPRTTKLYCVIGKSPEGVLP